MVGLWDPPEYLVLYSTHLDTKVQCIPPARWVAPDDMLVHFPRGAPQAAIDRVNYEAANGTRPEDSGARVLDAMGPAGGDGGRDVRDGQR